MPKYCIECGTPIEEQFKYCLKCAQKLNTDRLDIGYKPARQQQGPTEEKNIGTNHNTYVAYHSSKIIADASILEKQVARQEQIDPKSNQTQQVEPKKQTTASATKPTKFYPYKKKTTETCNAETKQVKKASTQSVDFRKKWPANYRCEDGHYVRSRGEKIIDDWLFHQRIVHVYEKAIFTSDEDENEKITCDFYIPDHEIYIEYYGKSDATYVERKIKKQAFYKNNEMKCIEIENSHITNIDDVLHLNMRKYQVKK